MSRRKDAVAKAYIDTNVDEEFRDYAWMILVMEHISDTMNLI